MLVEYLNGDIIEVAKHHNIPNIAHNCNCFHTMGAGIAKHLNDYTNGTLLKEDKTTIYGDINKLGSYSMLSYNGIKFFNLYGMFVYRSMLTSYTNKNVYVHWESLQTALVNAIMDSSGDFIIPVLGCNLAGGSSDDFITMIGNVIKSVDQGDRTLFIVEK